MILFFVILILAVVVFRMIYSKKIIKWAVVISVVCVLLISVHIVCAIISNTEKIDVKVLDKIASIKWDDDDYLVKQGFKMVGEELRYIGYDIREDFHPDYTFNIFVIEMDKGEAIKEYNLQNQNGLLCCYEKMNFYNNPFEEFFCTSDTGGRMYRFYLKDHLIDVHESNLINSDRLFEQFVMDL